MFYQLNMEFQKPSHWGPDKTDYLGVRSTLMGLPDDVVRPLHLGLMLKKTQVIPTML